MTESTALVVSEESKLDTLHRKARYMVSSGLLPKAINTPEKAITMMLLAEELGIGPIAAINNVNIIDGKPTISAQLALALFYRSGECEASEITGDIKQCSVLLKRRGHAAHTEVLTMDDAVRMGLSTKDTWRKYPKQMLQWRCLSNALRVVAPDILQGLYTPDEMGADNPPPRIKITDVDTGEVLLDEDKFLDHNRVDLQDGVGTLEGTFKEKEAENPEEQASAWSNLSAIVNNTR